VAVGTQSWAIADDSGLAIDALGGAPGIYSARYGLDRGACTDRDCIELILRELEAVEAQRQSIDRSAQFICAIAVARPDGSIVLEVEGICPGEIARSPQGEQGFGYDPIFLLPQLQRTFAEMDTDQKRQFSHRGKAFEQLIPQLPSLLGLNS